MEEVRGHGKADIGRAHPQKVTQTWWKSFRYVHYNVVYMYRLMYRVM